MVDEQLTRDEERRLVTVLFADLVGYTSASESRDPEVIQDALNLCFDRLAKEIRRFGGYVDKVVGDEIMALFGAPRAQEDDAGKAVAAALAMLDALEELAPQLDERMGQSFSIRVGINTGLVVTGAIGPGGYTVTGDAVNVAARLEKATDPGTVLVGDATRRLARRPFVWGERQEFTVKGRQEPVVCHRAERALSTPMRLVPVPSETPFVGRNELLTQLQDAWASAVGGSEHVLQLVGESGIGKTRLLSHLFTHVEPSPAHVLYTRADTPPRTFGPLMQLLPSLRDNLPPEFVQRIESLARPDEREEHSRAEAGWLADGLTDVIRSLASTGPVAFVLDDMHRADRATVEIVDRLITALRGVPVMFVLVRQPLGRRVRGVSSEQTLSLQPLSPDEARSLIASVATGLREPVVGQIVARAGGNPLYLELMAGAVSAAPEGTSVPESLQTAIAARIDELDTTSRQVLRDASVFGQSFYEEPLKLMTAANEGLFEALEHLCEIGLLDDLGDPQHRGYMFRHSLVQEVLYHALLYRRRGPLHRRAAEALVLAREEGLPVEPEELAFHYEQAGDIEQAAAYHLVSADKADGLDAPAEARAHRRAANKLLNMASLAGLYATNGRPSVGVRFLAAAFQALIAVLLILPIFLIFATRRPDANRLTLGLPFEIIDFNVSSILLAVVLGGLPLLVAGVVFAHLAVPTLMRRNVSFLRLLLVMVAGWLLALTVEVISFSLLIALLRWDALDDLSSKYVGGATLQLLQGNYALLWTMVAGTLALTVTWTVLLRLQARGWARLRARTSSPRAIERARRWGALRQAALLVGGVGLLTTLLMLVYQLGVLPNGSAQPGLPGASAAGVFVAFAILTGGGFAVAWYCTTKLEWGDASVQLGFFGFEIPLLLALTFGLVVWFGMRQAVIVSANGVDTPGSLTPFNRAVSLFPDMATAYYLRGERHLANGDFEAARSDFDEAAELDPSFPATYLARGRVLVQLGEMDAALRDADHLIELKPDHPGGYAIRALAKAGKGDVPGAASDLEFATRPLPEDARAWDAYFVRCLALAAVNRLEEAEADCQRVQELNHNHIISLDQLGLIAFSRADAEPDREQAVTYFEQGIDYMTRVLDVQPDNAAALTNRGDARVIIGQYTRDEDVLQQGDADLTRALEIEPDLVRALTSRALGRLYLDQPAGAKADIDRALALYDEDPQAAQREGTPAGTVNATALFIALYGDRYEDVVPQAEELIADGFTTTWVLSNRGLAKAELGDTGGALADLDQAIAAEPNAALAHERRGYVYFLMGDLDRAEVELNEALRLASLLNPEEQAELSYHRALLLQRQGQNALAAAELQQATERAEVPSVRKRIEELQAALGG